MPYIRVGKCVYKKNSDGSRGEKKGCSDTVEKAKDYMKALYASEKNEQVSPKMECPLPTQDLEVNTKNRNAAIKADYIQYGPLNVDEPGTFWGDIAEHWNTTEQAAKKSLCGNCVAFDISKRMLECMPGPVSDDDGLLGHCWMHNFKCHSARTCRTWAKGGPITEDKISYEWQAKKEKETMEENKLRELIKNILKEKLDPVGKEDDDINNDGKVDKTDKYLANRRKNIAKNIKKEDFDIGHEDDEPEMIREDLYIIVKYAQELADLIEYSAQLDVEVDFPHWWQSYIIKAKDYIVKAKQFLEEEFNEPTF